MDNKRKKLIDDILFNNFGDHLPDINPPHRIGDAVLLLFCDNSSSTDPVVRQVVIDGALINSDGFWEYHCKWRSDGGYTDSAWIVPGGCRHIIIKNLTNKKK